MSPEKEKILVNKFTKIFDSNFYFECDDGWFNLIHTLCNKIQSYIDWKYADLSQEDLEQIQPRAIQVKEKFGGLRFYCNGGDDFVDGLIAFAEDYSYNICQSCSNKATLYKDGWNRSHCQSCEFEYQKKRNGSIS